MFNVSCVSMFTNFIKQKATFKLVTFYSMPTAVLFIFRKRLNFIYYVLVLFLLLLI